MYKYSIKLSAFVGFVVWRKCYFNR